LRWRDADASGLGRGVQAAIPDGHDEVWVADGQRAGQVYGAGVRAVREASPRR
jgi:hypothetical protein